MIAFAGKIFAPPVFEDEEKTRQAYFLNIVAWTLFSIPPIYFAYILIKVPTESVRTLIQGGFAELITILILYLIRNRQLNLAILIQISALWIFFTTSALTGAGVRGESYLLGYPLVIMIAGILKDRRVAIGVTALSLATGWAMAFTESRGLFSPTHTSNPMTAWVISLIIFPMGTILQTLATRTLQSTLQRANDSEERYKLISRVSSDYTFASDVDKQGNVSLVWVAGAFEKMTGYTYEEYEASGGWLGHVHPDDLEKDNQDMEKLYHNQDIQSEIRTFTKNGEIRWEQIFAHPIWDQKENRLVRIIGAVRDITRQKQIEAELASERDLLQIFMDNMPDQVYLKDTESRFVRVNQAQAHFLGIDDPQDALGKTDLDFQSPELAHEFTLEEKRILETGQPIWNRIEFNPTKDGKPRWLSTTKVPVKNQFGQTIGTIGTSTDITELKKAEELEQNRRIMLEKVVKLGQNMTEVHDLRTTIKRIWQGVHDDLGFDRLGIYLYNPESNSMNGTFGTSIHGDMIDEWHTRISLEQEKLEAKLFLRVLENPNRIYLTHTYENDFNVPEGHIMSGVKDFAAIATSAGAKPVAVLCVDHLITGRPISEVQLEALRLFAGYAGLAIENARLNENIQNELAQQIQSKEREKRRRAILEKAVKLGQHVTEVSDLRTTLTKIWQGVHDDLGFDRVGLYLYNPERNSMDGSFGTNNQGEMTDEWNIRISLDENSQEVSPFLQAFKQPDMVFFTHSYEDDYLVPERHSMSGVKDHALIAAWAGEKPMAAISVDHRITGRPITEEQLEGLRLFAGYAGLAIENARLNTVLQNELAQHRETLLQQTAILNSIPDMAWLKNPKGEYVAVNEQFTKTAGMKIEDVIGKTDLDIWDKEYAEMYRKDDLEVMQSGQRKHVEELQQDGRSRQYWVETFKTPILNEEGEVIGTVGIAREITERKKAEIEREILIGELEAKNAELERYTYTVSHDLKSPLVTIRGFLGYLEKDALSGNVQKIKDDVRRIEHATKKMQMLLNDLLELSRIGRLMNQPTESLFTDIARDAVELVNGQIENRNALIVIHDTPARVYGDRTRLTEVIQNLVDNAIKFMGGQTNPQVTIGSVTNEANETIFFVRDNGIGIEKQYHDRVFTLFNKLSAETEGTGIGLTLVKRIIEIHKGRIWIESDPGKGTTFYFTLEQPKSQ